MPKAKLIKVGVLMGGSSAEHEISIETGKNILKNLNASKYKPLSIKITKRGQWFLSGKLSNQSKAIKSCDVIFNALHGTFGEDGKMQAILESHKAKYTGSGIGASALAMDKLHSKEIFKLAGFNVPKSIRIRKKENYAACLSFFKNKLCKFPLVIKPCSNGSSIGVGIVKNEKELSKHIDKAFAFDDNVLVEEYIKGKEVACGVIDNYNGRPIFALPVTEIIPMKKHKFFDYDAKYKIGHAKEITPAFLDEDLYNKVQSVSERAHQILGCHGYSRTDMILKNGNGSVYVLETNTLPGLTLNSLIPKAAREAGLTMEQLLDNIIQSSLDR
jgi:D-alanine-D-alanine ligase